MKRILVVVVMAFSVALLTACCSDSICDIGSTYVPASTSSTKSCSNCSTCGSCGYDTSYTYSGWY